MNGLDTLISTVSGAIGGGITGVIGALLSWRTLRHTVERDKVQDYFSSYQDDIANLEKLCEALAEGADKEETKHEIIRLRKKQHEEREAWRQTQHPPGLIPRGAVAADAPKPSAEELDQIRAFLATSTRLPTTLLSEIDYFIRGNAYYKAGDYRQALDAYTRALELSPDSPIVLYNRGIVLIEMKRYEEALRDFDRTLGLRPDDPRILYISACVRSLQRNFQESLRNLERAIAADRSWRDAARTDQDFENLRNDPEYGPRFRELVGEE